MATESLIVELDARTAKLDKALTETNKRLDNLDKQTGKNDKSFGKLSESASFVAEKLEAGAVAGLALASALTAVILKSADSNRELKNLAATAGTSAENFSALSFAMKQYGVDAKGTADAMNDVSERVAEFAIAGSGAMQDFFDTMGMSKVQARQFAREIEHLTGEEITQKLVNDMQEASVSTARMNFVLKSLTNDLSYSAAAFIDNGKAVKNLKSQYESATKALKLTSGEIKDLQGAATSFDLLTGSLTKAGTLISANLAPLLTEFFSGIIEVVPEATQTIVDFINSFKDPEQIKSVKNLNSLIEKQHGAISILRQETTALSGDLGKWWSDDRKITSIIAEKNLQLKEEEERLRGLISARDDLSKINEERVVIPGGDGSGGFGTGGTGDEVQAIEDRFKSETELLKQKLDSELEIVGENNVLRLELEQEYQDNLAAIKREADENAYEQGQDLRGLFEDNQKLILKDEKDAAKQKDQINSDYFSAASALANAAFEDNKAVKAGLVVVDTAAGISRAFAELPYPAALAASASIAATGIVQLAAIQGASKGGGSISRGASGSATTTSTGDQESSSNLSVDTSDTSGAGQDFVIRFEGNGDDITEAIAKNMKVMQLSGSLS